MGARSVILGLVTLSLLATVPPPASAGSLDGIVLVVDAGHGGSDPGAVALGLREADVVLDVALRARDLLEADGATVLMTRTCDCTVSLADRAALANGNGADRFLSVHANACGGCGGHGTETFYHSSLASTSTSAALARDVQAEMLQALGRTDRGVKQADFYVLRETNMPAVLVELAFVDHAGDNAILADPAMRQEAARALLFGVQRHYGIAPHDPTTPPGFAVSVLRPSAGAWVGGIVTAEGRSNQESNLAWMRFLVDGAVTQWATPAPHTWVWDTTGWADGSHTLAVEAQNSQGTRALASIASKVDNTPPTAAITAPRANAVHVDGVSIGPSPLTIALGQVPFEADSLDPSPGSGVASVTFLVDGIARFTDASAPYAWTWPAEAEALGSHTLTARAADRVGNARSASMTVHLTAPTTVAGVLASL